MKKVFLFSLAGLIAVAIMSVFSLFYYNYGIRKTSESGSTDYVWENRFFCQAFEGFGYGIRDKNGLNNFYPGVPDKRMDILVMGSSQGEANNVPYNCNYVYRLNKKLAENDYDSRAYNIAMEGHTIYRQVNNLSYALKEFLPQKYVVMEIIDLNIESMKNVITDNYERSLAYDSGILYFLQKIPYFRVVNKKRADYIEKIKNQKITKMSAENIKQDISKSDFFEISESFINLILNECKKYDVKPIIIYLSPSAIDGNYTEIAYDSLLYAFKEICNKNNVLFIDSTDAFRNAYLKDYTVPYGFSNTRLGEGHLNSDGHRLIADVLYQNIVNDVLIESN